MTPLDNIKILDLTRFVAGPFCTQLLADMGAEVIKIESPDRGDETRHQGAVVNGESWYFVGLNRNKKSLTLDLKSKEGKEIFRRLAGNADVVVENFRPGVMRNFGFDYENLRKINPRLIYCGISGFGKDGPYALRPAFDFIAQGLSGFMSITGFPDREPVRTGIPISDSIAGTLCRFRNSGGMDRPAEHGKGAGGPDLSGGCHGEHFELSLGRIFRPGQDSPEIRQRPPGALPLRNLPGRRWVYQHRSLRANTCGRGWRRLLGIGRIWPGIPDSKPTPSACRTVRS